MTHQEFLLLQPFQKIYNPSKSIFATVSIGTGLKTDEDIAKAIAERINGAPDKRWYITASNYIYKGNTIDVTGMLFHVIPLEEHEDWVPISSIIEIEDQKLVNLILMAEILRIKDALSKPTPGLRIHNSII